MEREGVTKSSPLKKKVVSLDDNRRPFIFSPLCLIFILSLCICIVESLVNVVFDRFMITGWTHSLIDSSILTIVLFSILYFYLFKPLVALVDNYQLKTNQLKTNQELLEQNVLERTAELNTAYLALKAENEETLKARAALRESVYRFRQLFEQSEDAIILISPQNLFIIDVNHTAERLFGKARSELLAGGLSALCDSEAHKTLVTALENICHDGVSYGIERFKCTIDPQMARILSFRGKLITLDDVKIVYATFRDITTRVRLEEEAQAIQARLIQVNRMTSLGTMVCSVAHEINNPNNFLLMNARIIKQAWEDIAPVLEEHCHTNGDFAVAHAMWSEARTFLPEAFEGVEQGALRISDIVGTLKSFGRDDRFLRDSLADVNAVVQLSVSILNNLIASSTRRFTLELVDGLPLVRGSARQLGQVVINLIQNALLALPDPEHGVRVVTGLDPESDQVLIRISDEGSGIVPEIAARIMEPFFTTRLEQGGTGLGLAISATIVKEHGGSIEFCSEPGKGTTFTVRLCRAENSENDTTKSEVQNNEH